ncbi:MAG: hypothetical protein RLZZ273_1435, partial [Bacteroidota bacterium]
AGLCVAPYHPAYQSVGPYHRADQSVAPYHRAGLCVAPYHRAYQSVGPDHRAGLCVAPYHRAGQNAAHRRRHASACHLHAYHPLFWAHKLGFRLSWADVHRRNVADVAYRNLGFYRSCITLST